MDQLFLVRKGNEQFYCPPEQVDYWASEGYTVFSFTPEKIAGPDIEEAEETAPTVEVTIEEQTTNSQSGFSTARIGETDE